MTASSIPRSVASSPAASESKQRKSRCVSRLSSRSWCSVSAVPIEATTGITTRLPQGDHVRVALDDERPVLLRHRTAREVEPVQDVRLVEELALGRVDVLAAQRIVLAQLARLEADDPAARVGERKHQPPLEVVRAAPGDEAGPGELLGREPLLARLLRERRARGREAEPELATDFLAQSPRREVLLNGLAGVGPQGPLVERRRLVEQRVEPLLALALRIGLAATTPRTRARR